LIANFKGSNSTIIEIVGVIYSISIRTLGISISGKHSGLHIKARRESAQISPQDRACFACRTERLLGREERVRRIAQFVIKEDIEEISCAEFINCNHLPQFKLEQAMEKSLLIPELIESHTISPRDTAAQRVDVKEFARQVLSILINSGKEKFTIKLSELIEIHVG